ncbi:MAG TPA: arsenite methyltransferase [Anaerohalosphaeraceae bacterium]|nr:arsenite methyltransferase [Anaerohalosphaeraceae bacterium]HPP55700.1 arsenite methyltransferase [Anaerohalosphaeraceae bacterium]
MRFVMTDSAKETIRQTVRQEYSKIAQGKSSCCCGCTPSAQLAQNLGYSSDELALLPDGANLGLSCGNPTALADLKPGQVVLDLGSGGGIDVFIAACKVGPTGRAVGVDMTPDMVSKARASIAAFTKKTGLSNVEFRLGEIEHLPVADGTIDVVISNCVINLSPDKQQVWNEIARVLKPVGKACISDLALRKPLPENIARSAAALVSCVAGAVPVEQTLQMAKQAGLCSLKVEEHPYSIELAADCNDPLYRQVKESLPPGAKLSDYIISINLTAFKPERKEVLQ